MPKSNQGFFFLETVHRGRCYAMSFTLSVRSQQLWFPLITPVPRLKPMPVCSSELQPWLWLVVLWLALYLPITDATVSDRLILSWSLIFMYLSWPFKKLQVGVLPQTHTHGKLGNSQLFINNFENSDTVNHSTHNWRSNYARQRPNDGEERQTQTAGK